LWLDLCCVELLVACRLVTCLISSELS
jgi:hypothetical protein